MAVPIPARKIKGVTSESIASNKTIKAKSAATATYNGISERARFLISVTTPDIPLI